MDREGLLVLLKILFAGVLAAVALPLTLILLPTLAVGIQMWFVHGTPFEYFPNMFIGVTVDLLCITLIVITVRSVQRTIIARNEASE